MKNSFLQSNLFRTLNNYSWWVQNAADGESASLLKRLDSVAVRIEINNSTVLGDKIKFITQREKKFYGVAQKLMNDTEYEKEDQVWSLFSEIAAYDMLTKNGYQNIQFLPTQETKQPDLIAEKDSQVFYVEVKRARAPNEESKKLRKNGFFGSYVNDGFVQDLITKVEFYCTDAAEKFLSVGAVSGCKILILDYQPGIDAILNTDFDQRNSIIKTIGNSPIVSLSNKYDMQIIELEF